MNTLLIDSSHYYFYSFCSVLICKIFIKEFLKVGFFDFLWKKMACLKRLYLLIVP